MIRLFMCGDVMTGRGLDQALRHPGDPLLHEPWVKDAGVYVQLAEEASGPVDAPLAPAEPWGDVLPLLREWRPDVRLANLETVVTARGQPWPGKGIHYRMHPDNADCLSTAGLDVCSLANNHVLDWGYHGLLDTLDTLETRGIGYIGAGRSAGKAHEPRVCELPGDGKLQVFAWAVTDSGIPPGWSAEAHRPGIAVLPSLSDSLADSVIEHIRRHSAARDRVVVSLHWGGNWGYEVDDAQRRFARRLIDDAGVDVIHGHSAHHPKGVEVYNGRLILYGCGDCLNDYEGIGGHEHFRPEIGAVYLAELSDDGSLNHLSLVPLRRRRLQLERAGEMDRLWLAERLERVSAPLGGHFETDDEGLLHWTGEEQPARAGAE